MWRFAAAPFLAAMILAVPVIAQEAVPAASPAPATEKTGGLPTTVQLAKSDVARFGYNTIYAGALFRSSIGLYNNYQAGRWRNQYQFQGGVEVGDRYFGFSLCYSQEQRYGAKTDRLYTVHEIHPALRAFYNFKVGRILLAPFFELDPTILFGDVSGVHVTMRPGFRATFLLTKWLDVAVEPVSLDMTWYRFERYGPHSVVDLGLSLRYGASIGMHARW
jgi:hypothetical protein